MAKDSKTMANESKDNYNDNDSDNDNDNDSDNDLKKEYIPYGIQRKSVFLCLPPL